MKRKRGRKPPLRDRIDRITLLILAIGLLIAVAFSVAKGAVRDYRELEHEIQETPVLQSSVSVKSIEPRAVQASTRSQGERIIVVVIETVPASPIPSVALEASQTLLTSPGLGAGSACIR